MLRVAIIPVSMLLAYVFFTPIESLDGGVGPNMVVPEGSVLLPAGPAYESLSEGISDGQTVVEEPVAEEPVARRSGGRESADIAQVLTAMVNESSGPREKPLVEPVIEEFVIHDMAGEEAIEVAVDDISADVVFAEKAGVDDPPVEEPAADETVVENSDNTTESEMPAVPDPEPKPELSPAMAAVRDRLRHTTTAFYRQTLSTTENTATDLMHYCLAFGCESQVAQGASSSVQNLNGITHLCWNYPCGGFEPLTMSDGRIAARIGYGVQQHHSQLLAVLALSRVQADYPMRVGEHVGTVADLVEHEKLNCRAGDDLSLKLIGLSYYVEQPTWNNDLGEEWSIERMVEEELEKPLSRAEPSGIYRLMGLSQAVAGRTRSEQPVDGQFARAQKFVEDYQDYALTLQNADGSWGPRFLATRETSGDLPVVLESTGHVLQWLVMSLPEEQMEDARVVRSVEYVGRLLGSSRYRNGVRSLSAREIGSVMHALHALMVYDQRYLAPRTPKPTAEAS